MKVEYINPFIVATIKTFEVMINEKVEPGKPELLKKPLADHDISGIIGISGSATGSITLSFPKTAALKISAKLLGADMPDINPDVTDAIGELANIVAGNAKQDLGNLDVLISLPNVVTGSNVSVACPTKAYCILIPFNSEMGIFSLMVSLQMS